MAPPGPTSSDEATATDEASVRSEYCMDGEARSPNLPYPNGTRDESSVRSEYYPTGQTESDQTSSSDYSDSILGTDPDDSWIDVRTTFSDDSSSARSIPPRDYNRVRITDYNARLGSMFASPDDTSSTSSSPDSSDDDESTESSAPEPPLPPPDVEMLRNVIPSPCCDIVLASLFDAHFTPPELYEALGIAIEVVHVQEKWKVAEAEDPLERAKRIKKLRADDEIRSAPSSAATTREAAFSRACGVCYADAPRERAVMTACGHIVCAPCADTMAQVGRFVCPYCRVPTGYVVLVEEEEQEGSLAAEGHVSDAETNKRIDSGIKKPLVSCHLPLNC